MDRTFYTTKLILPKQNNGDLHPLILLMRSAAQRRHFLLSAVILSHYVFLNWIKIKLEEFFNALKFVYFIRIAYTGPIIQFFKARTQSTLFTTKKRTAFKRKQYQRSKRFRSDNFKKLVRKVQNFTVLYVYYAY